VRDPEVFLFDEPLSNLDAKLRTQMRVEIKTLHQRLKNTIVYVTHDQVEAMTLADRIVVMRSGIIEQQGTPDEIFHNPVNTFVAGFMGSPQMNLVESSVSGGKISIGDANHPQLTAEMQLPDGAVTFGIRPDDIELLDEQSEEANNQANKQTVKISLVEPVGTEKLFHFSLGGKPFIGKADGRMQLSEGQTVNICLDMQYGYYFDAQSGERIR